MVDGKSIKIWTIPEKHRTSLCLEGAILSYREKTWAHTGMMNIPIELITIFEHKRFQGRRLISAFISALLGLSLGGVFFSIITLGIDPALGDTWAGWGFAGFIITGLIGCVSFLISFLFRQRAITLRVAPQNFKIQFWVQRGNSNDIGKMIDAIRHRIPVVGESMTDPVNHPIGEIMIIPWKRTTAQVLLCLIPGLILEDEWLLPLGLIPIAAHVYRVIISQEEPVALRQARSFYQNENRRLALESVSKSIASDPEYLPARMFKISLLIVQGDLQLAEMECGEAYDLMTPKEIEGIDKWIGRDQRIPRRPRHRETKTP